MIPKVTTEAPNIVPRKWCTVCGSEVKEHNPLTGKPTGWKFCPICGSSIEWENVGPTLLLRKEVRVTLDNENSFVTLINGSAGTVAAYYRVGKTMNIGGGPLDEIAAITGVEIIGEEEIPL